MKRCFRFLLLIFICLLIAIPQGLAFDYSIPNFVPKAQTAYATTFIALCDGQQWFMNSLEKELNAHSLSINTLNSITDLNVVTSLSSALTAASGKIPRAIGQLTQLRQLLLVNKKLTGVLPTELFSCTKLVDLDLSQNTFNGTLTNNFANLVQLENLMLQGNQFSGTIPANLSTLPLINMDLSNNKLTGGIPPQIGNMVTLQVLNLSNNVLSGTIPSTLGNLSNLRVLGLKHCNLSGAIPIETGNIISLSTLDISSNNLTGEIPQSYSSLSQLEALSVSDNKLSGNIPDIWGNMPNVRKCLLGTNQFTGRLPASLITAANNGADVHIEKNFLNGAIPPSITHNAENYFTELPANQVKLYVKPYNQLVKGTKVNIYTALQTLKVADNTVVAKEKLPVSAYEVLLLSTLANPSDYVQLTSDAVGLYITLLKDISFTEALEFEVRLLPYDSTQTFMHARFKLGTALDQPPTTVPSSGGLGGGTAPGQYY